MPASAALAGTVAVVTGGGKGIGAEIARRLASAGAAVTIFGRDADALERVAAMIEEEGGLARTFAGDVTDPDCVEELMSAAAEDGRIDILVNNAGIAGPTAPLAEVALKDWEQTLAVNLTGVFLCCRAAIPFLRRSTHARIVNVGALSGKKPLVNRTPYTTSKLGLIGLTRTLAHELGCDGVTVNTVSPGPVIGDRLETVVSSMAAVSGRSTLEVLETMIEGSALQRAVTAAEVAEAVLFLVSPGASGVTGQDVHVNAGSFME